MFIRIIQDADADTHKDCPNLPLIEDSCEIPGEPAGNTSEVGNGVCGTEPDENGGYRNPPD